MAGLVLAVILYAPALAYDFILDDLVLIVLNPRLDDWRNLPLAFTQHLWAFAEPPVEPRHYRPLVGVWLTLNHHLFGGLAPWWHLMSILLHVVVTALVYRLALRLTRDAWTAALALALFAVHAVHMETVVWISAVPDLLATGALLAAFIFYLRYRGAGGARWLGLSIVLAFAASLCKETALVFPGLIAGYELLQKQKRLPLVVPYAAVGIAFLGMRKLAMPVSAARAADADWSTIFATLPVVAFEYARLLLVPYPLSFFHSPPQWTWAAAMGVPLLLLLLIIAWRITRGDLPARTAVLWFAVFAVPPLAAIAFFTRDNWVHERHLYLPSAGFCLLTAMLLMRLPARARVAGSAFLIVLWGAPVGIQLGRFQNELSLYGHALQRAPDNLELRLARANALAFHGHHAESTSEYGRIADLFPGSAEAWFNLGADYQQDKRLGAAQAALRRAVDLAPPGSFIHRSALFRLAQVELARAELAAAEAHLREVITLDPLGWNYHGTLAHVLRLQGRFEESRREQQKEAAVRREIIARRARR